ncbi:hypothetical protein GQ44DRAFT_552925, partial [Phaeosphaeriaceae sp. PMI808]
EIIPGEGLPSLESLGWNSTYINSLPDPELKNGEMSIMAEARCGDSYVNVNEAIQCYKFLNALGTFPCRVPSGQRSTILAQAGRARIEGHGIGQSSYCSDVALAILWVIDHCTRPAQDTGG